jgi:hypothetical protein
MSDDEKTARPRRARSKREVAANDAPAAATAGTDDAERTARRRPRSDGTVSEDVSATTRKRAVESDDAPVAPAPVEPGRPASIESVGRPLVASAVAAAIGLAVVGTSTHQVGPWVLAAGVIGLIASIHRLGRLGPA